MRRLLLLTYVALLLVGLAGCGSTPTTQLTMVNNSSFYAQSMQWSGYDFGAISIGGSRTMQVNPGTDYVLLYISGYWFRTVQSVDVSQGNHATFTLTDYTYVYNLSGTAAQSADTPIAQLKDLMADLK